MNRIHIIGIGGIAMSAIAQYFIQKGDKVTGSDLNRNELVDKLESKGVEISIGHKADNISPAIDKVIFSDAIPENNIELKQARKDGIEILNRSEALALITKNKKVISAAGTHGKTTTSSMIAQILAKGKLNPSFIIGGILNNFNSNFLIDDGEYFVLEGDEYGKSFLKYPSDIGVVTNIEFDHPDIYEDLEELTAAYREYVENLDEYLITNKLALKQIGLSPEKLDIEVITVGVNDQEAVYNATNIKSKELTSYFTLEYQGEEVGDFEIAALGEYNVKHALEAIAVGRYCGLSLTAIKEALKDWQGVKRRFEVLYRDEERIIITDYAHHPQEVKAIVSNLDQIKTEKDKIVIFQPHQYIRTKSLLEDYDNLLNYEIDKLIIYEIYKVREKVKNKELERLGREVKRIISSQQVDYSNNWKELEQELINYDQNKSGIYLFLGAGNIDEFARDWVDKLFIKE